MTQQSTHQVPRACHYGSYWMWCVAPAIPGSRLSFCPSTHVLSANHTAQMFSKLAVFGLVAFATAAEMVSEGSGDDNNVVDGDWAESSSVLSVQTLMQSNTSAVVVPTACKQGCPCCTPMIVRYDQTPNPSFPTNLFDPGRHPTHFEISHLLRKTTLVGVPSLNNVIVSSVR